MVEQLCQVCWEKPGLYTCKLCGRRVCGDHITSKGICVLCARSLCEICGENLSIGYCAICGRLGCWRCLVQIDNVRRVCIDCIGKYNKKDIYKFLYNKKEFYIPMMLTKKIIETSNH